MGNSVEKLDGVRVETQDGNEKLRHHGCVGGDRVINDSPTTTSLSWQTRLCDACGSPVEFAGPNQTLKDAQFVPVNRASSIYEYRHNACNHDRRQGINIVRYDPFPRHCAVCRGVIEVEVDD